MVDLTAVVSKTKADVYLTGEMGHHDVLSATENGTCVVLCEHTNTGMRTTTAVIGVSVIIVIVVIIIILILVLVLVGSCLLAINHYPIGRTWLSSNIARTTEQRFRREN